MDRNGNELNDRKKLILKAIIETHVKDGEPVGSKYLMQNKQIALSSATIRNEMAELESLGYLEQPHTSAGRVPSENGYRFYVNSLMQKYRMSQNELTRMNALMKNRLAEVDRLLESATQLAAALTHYTSLAVKPKRSATGIDRFKTVLIGEDRFMLVMIDGSGNIQTRQIHTDETLTAPMLERLELLLNTHLVGRRVDEITVSLVMEMEKQIGEGEGLIGPTVKCICETMSELDGGDLKYAGVNHLLSYPEYADAHEFQELLGVLEEKNDILKLVSETPISDDGPQVIIGSENGVEEMRNSTLVFQKIKAGGKVIGAIGILGPRRMDYSKVISTVGYIADNISELLNTTPQLSDGEKQPKPE